jgi:hypothetical protein
MVISISSVAPVRTRTRWLLAGCNRYLNFAKPKPKTSEYELLFIWPCTGDRGQ